jgi:hypothetical protein
MESLYFYQLEYGGNWVLGTSKTDVVKGNYFAREVNLVAGVWYLGIIDPKDNSYKVEPQRFNLFKKENGQPYLSIEELDRVCEPFFGLLEKKVKSVYTAFLTQVGTGDPEAEVLENTIRGVVWTREAAGTYHLTKVGAFVGGKTVPIKDVAIDIDDNKLTMERLSADVMVLKTYAAADNEVLADDVLADQYVNIEIYS